MTESANTPVLPPLRNSRSPHMLGRSWLLFWDSKSVIMTDHLSKSSTVTGAYYANELRQLHEALKSKRRGKLRRWVLLLHDNAPGHISTVAMSAAAECGYELLPYSLYSPDLAPSDFYLFLLLKEHLSGTHFSSDSDVIASVEVFLWGQNELFYKTGIQKLQKPLELVHWSWQRLCCKIN